MSPAAKRTLLELLTVETACGDQRGPLMVALHRYVASLVDCLEARSRALSVPVVVEEPPEDGQAAGDGGGQ